MFKHPKILFFIFAIITLLSSCGTYQKTKKFSGLMEPKNGFSGLYVYRPSVFFLAGAFPTVYLNDMPLVELLSGGYYYQEISAGQHKLEIKKDPKIYTEWWLDPVVLQINAEANKIYFVRVQSKFDGKSGHSGPLVQRGLADVKMMEKSEAEIELMKTKLIEK